MLKLTLFAIIIASIICSCIAVFAEEIPFTDENCIRAIIGEASNQGYKGLLYVAVGLRNRGYLEGVYGLNADHVDKEPQWVWDLAKKAWAESKHNRLHSGAFWENVKAFGKPDCFKDMVKVCEYKDHIFFKEK